MENSIEKKNLLLTGQPGVGKTTLVEKVVQNVPLRVDGFITGEIRREGRRIGFEIRTLSGERGVLASRTFSSPYRVGRYGVDVSCFKRLGVGALERAIGNASLVVIDEIGKMELLCPGFRQAVLKALDSPKMVLATIKKGRGMEVGGIKRRLDVTLVEVTVGNRDRLVEEVIRWVLSEK